MNREMLAEWLRDIAQHIDEGLARKIITITFNAPGRAPQPEEDVGYIPRH